MLGFGSQRKICLILKHGHTQPFLHMSSSSILQKKRYIKKQVNECRIRFSTWNIGTLKGKAGEVIGVMRDRKINILSTGD